MSAPRIAVLVPCLNEAATVVAVVQAFQEALPNALIYVYDNNSDDATANLAHQAGAIVRTERRRGKGRVLRRMFADVDADIYVMVDGDQTYDASAAPGMVHALVAQHLDLVNGARQAEAGVHRPGHALGNRALSGVVQRLFGPGLSDMLSGYKVLSRRFVKSFPANSDGFEVETEIAVHALTLDLPIAEVPTRYTARPEGSHSKLSTQRDGLRIALTIGRLLGRERPAMFFGGLAAALVAVAAVLISPLLWAWWQTGLVPRLPTLVVTASLAGVACTSFACGLVLEASSHRRLEARRLAYLSTPLLAGDSVVTVDECRLRVVD